MMRSKIHTSFLMGLLILASCFMACDRSTPKKTEANPLTPYQKYSDTAEEFYNKGVYDSAFYYYNQIKTQSDPKKEADKLVYVLLKMAAIQQTQSDYIGSEATATEAIPYFNPNTEAQYKVAIYNSLGINYKSLFDYKNAIRYYQKAKELADTPLQKEIIQNNIAVVYMDQHNYTQAIQLLTPLAQSPIAKENLEHQGRVLDNLGYCYTKMNDPKSEYFLKKALAIHQQLQYDYGLVTTYSNLAQYYKKSHPKLAYTFAEQSYSKAVAVQSADDRLSALELLMDLGEEKQIRKYSKLYLQLNDSLKKANQTAKNQFAKIKFDATQEHNENLQLKTEKAENALALEQQKLRNYVLFFVLFLVLIALTILYKYWKNKTKKEKQVAIYESEVRMAKKLHDELANEVYQTIAFTETHNLQDPTAKETLLDSLDHIYSRTRNISRENSAIPTGSNFEISLKEMLSSFSSNQIQVIVKGISTLPWHKIKEDKKIALYRILQELMVNMKKHSQASVVVLSFITDTKQYHVQYSDNGIGMPNPIPSKNGLQNVENRIRAIDGHCIFETTNSKGLKIKLTFPK